MVATNPELTQRETLTHVGPAAFGARVVCARLHRWMNVTILLIVPIQVYLAGAVMFGAVTLTPHRTAGFALLLLSLVSALLAGIARTPLASPRHAFILFALMFLQPILATGLRSVSAALAALHALNALAILGVAVLVEAGQRNGAANGAAAGGGVR